MLVEAEDPQYIDERRVEVSRRQLEGLAGSRCGVLKDAQGVSWGGWSNGLLHRGCGGGIVRGSNIANERSFRGPPVPPRISLRAENAAYCTGPAGGERRSPPRLPVRLASVIEADLDDHFEVLPSSIDS